MKWGHKILIGLMTLPVLIAALAGAHFLYIKATAYPLHSDAQSVPTATQSAPPAKWSAAVERARPGVIASVVEQNLPGLSVAVGIDGAVVWAEGFGFADLERKIGVRPEMRFRIAELSQPLTSAAVGLLIEQKKLSLDDEIQTYVPDFPKKQWPVTLRALMAQTAGIRNDAGDEEPLTPRCERTADAFSRFAEDPLRFEPGTKRLPSFYNWVLVSAAVEAVTIERFYRFMRTHVFEPLGMTSTVPDLSFSDEIPNRVTFYYPRFAGDPRYGPELVRDGDYSCMAGGAGFLSTPSDLVRFGLAIGAGKFLQPATVRLLQTSQRLRSGEDTGYGLGWRTETIALGGKSALMTGQYTRNYFLGGTASLMTFPERGLVVAVTSNIGSADTRSIALAIAKAFGS